MSSKILELIPNSPIEETSLAISKTKSRRGQLINVCADSEEIYRKNGFIHHVPVIVSFVINFYTFYYYLNF